jgi:hypothetical protein
MTCGDKHVLSERRAGDILSENRENENVWAFYSALRKKLKVNKNN